MGVWDDEYGQLPDNTEDVTKNAKAIDSKLSEEKRTIKSDVGICSSCLFCMIYERELGYISFKCVHYEKMLNPSKPKIIKCTEYKARNALSLQEMLGMAWTINPDKKTIQGFAK
jgi:hypothetical protein